MCHRSTLSPSKQLSFAEEKSQLFQMLDKFQSEQQKPYARRCTRKWDLQFVASLSLSFYQTHLCLFLVPVCSISFFFFFDFSLSSASRIWNGKHFSRQICRGEHSFVCCLQCHAIETPNNCKNWPKIRTFVIYAPCIIIKARWIYLHSFYFFLPLLSFQRTFAVR